MTWKTLALTALMAAGVACPSEAFAVEKNVMCVKTNTGQYFPVVRVSMMVVADGASTFEIVLKDGKGEAGVESVSFEKHLADIDFSKYQGGSNGEPYVDLTKKIYLMTSTGKYFLMKTLPTLEPQAGTSLLSVVAGQTTEKDVEYVYFFRGDEDQLGINAPLADRQENLVLMTPVSSELQVSGCGDAAQAWVYASNGQMVAQAPVSNGACTVSVAHLSAGTYIFKVGLKSLKFIKK